MNKNKSFFFKKKYWYNVYVFISYGTFLLLKISKNYQKWVYIGMGEVFFLETQRSCPKVQQSTLLKLSDLDNMVILSSKLHSMSK